jgi:hypothetical protein
MVTGVTSDSVSILSENWDGGAAPYTLSMSGSTVQSIITHNEYGKASTNTPYIEWLPIGQSNAGVGFDRSGEGNPMPTVHRTQDRSRIAAQSPPSASAKVRKLPEML